MKWSRVLRRYRWWLYGLLAVIACLTVVLPAAAQNVLPVTLNSMQESEQWWDQLWVDTFDPNNAGNISVYSFTTAVRFVIMLGTIAWLYQYGQKLVEAKGLANSINAFTQSFFPIVLAIIFLSNQGFYSRFLAYGLRDMVNSWSEGVMQQQVNGLTVRSALSDQLIAQDTKEAIALQAQKCMQMPQPAVALPSPTRPEPDLNNPLTIQQQQAYDYLECLQKLKDFAQKKKDEVSGVWPFVQRFIDKSLNSLQQVIDLEAEKRTTGSIPNAVDFTFGLADYVAGLGATAAYGPVLSFTQWLWMSFLEMAMWLLALFAPMFVAMSIIPGRQNMFFFWLIAFMTIGLAKVAYIIVIGVVAAQLSDQTTLLSSDMRFPMALGLFAPGVSFAVVTGGGIAAALSFRGQSIAVTGAAASVVSGTVASIGYSLFRYSDKHR